MTLLAAESMTYSSSLNIALLQSKVTKMSLVDQKLSNGVFISTVRPSQQKLGSRLTKWTVLFCSYQEGNGTTKDDRQKDREDGDWNQEFRTQRRTKHENSDNDRRREQNSRWLESLVGRASFQKYNGASRPRTQARQSTSNKERERQRFTEQQQRRRRMSKNKRQTTTNNKRQPPLHCQSSLLPSSSIGECREG